MTAPRVFLKRGEGVAKRVYGPQLQKAKAANGESAAQANMGNRALQHAQPHAAAAPTQHHHQQQGSNADAGEMQGETTLVGVGPLYAAAPTAGAPCGSLAVRGEGLRTQ